MTALVGTVGAQETASIKLGACTISNDPGSQVIQSDCPTQREVDLQTQVVALQAKLMSAVPDPERPRDCQERRDAGASASGHYYIWPHGPAGRRVFVFCDFVGNDEGWTVLLGGGNRVDNCELIVGDCDEAANGHSPGSLAGVAHGTTGNGVTPTASPSHSKFCCNATLAIADQTSYHREFCGDTGGYNNAGVYFCIQTSWMAGLPLREVRLQGHTTSSCGQPWGFQLKDYNARIADNWQDPRLATGGEFANTFQVVNTSAAMELRYVSLNTGCPGYAHWKYFAFRL